MEETRNEEEAVADREAKRKKDMALVAMILNIVLPFFTGFMVQGIGSLVFSAYEEKYKSRGLYQLFMGVGGYALFMCLTFATLGLGIVISWVFIFVPLAAYVWSILDGVEIFREYYI